MPQTTGSFLSPVVRSMYSKGLPKIRSSGGEIVISPVSPSRHGTCLKSTVSLLRLLTQTALR